MAELQMLCFYHGEEKDLMAKPCVCCLQSMVGRLVLTKRFIHTAFAIHVRAIY